MNRRSFVKKTALGGAAIATIGLLPSPTLPRMTATEVLASRGAAEAYAKAWVEGYRERLDQSILELIQEHEKANC